ncbi:MAG TPA: AAA family ATPase, partial [Firmicutes bacterium]|nr:AAA family ATPase [Bacillota bacterium]
LIVFSPHSDVLVAPAHDVLEDWALLQWIDEQHAIHEDSIQEFSKAIGTHPAVRRMYRKWVSELVEQDAKAADRMFRTVMDDVELPAYFQDDTLVSILRSSSSAEFLEKHSSELLMNDKQLLRRVIHLLRVACVTTHSRLDKTTAHALLITAPDGPAWVSVLRLVQAHLPSFAQEDRTLLLGLIEDWARGVSWKPPYPEGAESVAAIAHWLLEGFDDYWSDEERKQTLEVIAKIPKADPERFAALLQGGLDDRKEDRLARDFRAIIFEGLEGMPVGRDMPELVVSALNDYLLCSASELQREYGYLSRPTLELLFGIKPQRSFGFFPASAYRGPFLSLLRHHPRQGLDLIISILNHS